MTDMEIPQAAIEAGAAVLTDWFDVPKSAPACVKEVLRAALPHLLTEVKSREPEGEALEQMRQWYDDMEGPGPEEGDAVITREPGEILSLLSDAEVKSMCETAGQLGVRIGRKAALEEAEAAVIAVRDAQMPLSEVLNASTYGQLDKAVKAVRNLSSRVPGAASNGLTASSRHPGTPEDTKPPQGPCGDCGLTDDHMGGCPQTGEAPQPGAPG